MLSGGRLALYCGGLLPYITNRLRRWSDSMRKKGLKANYNGATPAEVARALVSHRLERPAIPVPPGVADSAARIVAEVGNGSEILRELLRQGRRPSESAAT